MYSRGVRDDSILFFFAEEEEEEEEEGMKAVFPGAGVREVKVKVKVDGWQRVIGWSFGG